MVLLVVLAAYFAALVVLQAASEVSLWKLQSMPTLSPWFRRHAGDHFRLGVRPPGIRPPRGESV